jgi:hypothetical protein
MLNFPQFGLTPKWLPDHINWHISSFLTISIGNECSFHIVRICILLGKMLNCYDRLCFRLYLGSTQFKSSLGYCSYHFKVPCNFLQPLREDARVEP